MAIRSDNEAFVATKIFISPSVTRVCPNWGRQRKSKERLNQTFWGSLEITDVRENSLEVKSSRSPSKVYRRPSRRSQNLPKFKIATFYPTDVELWFNQIENQFDLHDIIDDDERYRLTCAALSGEVASDVRYVLLQPFLTRKYENLKNILNERRGLTTPERVNKVISGEKIGYDIPSRFLSRLQKTDLGQLQ